MNTTEITQKTTEYEATRKAIGEKEEEKRNLSVSLCDTQNRTFVYSHYKSNCKDVDEKTIREGRLTHLLNDENALKLIEYQNKRKDIVNEINELEYKKINQIKTEGYALVLCEVKAGLQEKGLVVSEREIKYNIECSFPIWREGGMIEKGILRDIEISEKNILRQREVDIEKAKATAKTDAIRNEMLSKKTEYEEQNRGFDKGEIVKEGRKRFLKVFDDDNKEEKKIAVSIRCSTPEEAKIWLNPYTEEQKKYSIRQGDLYFLKVNTLNGFDEEENALADFESGAHSYDWDTSAGSTFTIRTIQNTDNEKIGGTNHIAEHLICIQKSGDVMFCGRRNMNTHSFTANPRFFVKGKITHQQHAELCLEDWYEVKSQKGNTLQLPAD